MKTIIALMIAVLVPSFLWAATLYWTASESTPEAPVEGYNIYHAASFSAPFTYVGSTGAMATTFSDTDGAPGNCWLVRAVNSVGESSPSNKVCWLIVAPSPPGRLGVRP